MTLREARPKSLGDWIFPTTTCIWTGLEGKCVALHRQEWVVDLVEKMELLARCEDPEWQWNTERGAGGGLALGARLQEVSKRMLQAV